MNNYQFEQIARKLQKEHGKISKGETEEYAMLLLPLEGNALKIHRKHPEANDLRMLEAINLAMHRINGRITGEMPNLSAFESPTNILLQNALLMAMDPFTNDEIHGVLTHDNPQQLEDRLFLKNYYHLPILCLMRIQESVQLWNRNGSNGYFTFIESSIGKMVKDDDVMDFTFPLLPDQAGDLMSKEPKV